MVSKKSHQPDRRSLKTQQQLKENFIAFLHDKPIDKITVAELARACNIGRGTFYIHYKDVYDLYDAIVDDTVNQLNLILEKLFPHDGDSNFQPLSAQIIKFVVNHKSLFEALTNHGTNVLVLKRINTLVACQMLEELHVTSADPKYLALVQFTSSGLISVVMDWVINRPQAQLSDLTDVISVTIATLKQAAKALESPQPDDSQI